MTFMQILLFALACVSMVLPAFGLLLAVDPSTRRPGVGILINLRSGPSSSASGAIRYLILSPKNATGGTATVETLYEAVANADAVSTLLGPGSLGHLAACRLFEENPTATVDVIGLTASGGAAATGTFTFDATSPVTVAQTVVAKIAGREVVVVWAAGETATVIGARLVAKIAAMTKFLPVTSANSSGVVTATFKSKGPSGNDCKISITMKDGAGGSAVASGAALTGGSTEPSVVTALGLVAAREYRLIVPCLSNGDLSAASATGGVGRIKTHITGRNTGVGALLQTGVFACTDSTTNAKAMSAQHNLEYFSHHLWRGALSLPCEVSGAIAGAIGRDIRTDPNHNWIGYEFIAELYGSPTIESDALSAAEAEDLLASGVSYIEYTQQRAPRLARPITCYYVDSDSNLDDRVLDIGKVYGAIAVASDLRTECQRAFRGKKIVPNLAAGTTPIPPNVVTVSAAKGFVVGRIRSQWVAAGVVRGDSLDQAVDDGSLVVQVDPLDETQLDFFLPLRIVPPLVKTSIVIAQGA